MRTVTSVSETRWISVADLDHALALAEQHLVTRLSLKLIPEGGHVARQLALLERVGER